MKRTAEVTLGIIAVCLNFLALIIGLIVKGLGESDVVRDSISESGASAADTADLMSALDVASNASTVLIWNSIIAVVIGLIATILVAKNKKPTAAGWLFVINAVLIFVIALTSGGFSIFTPILYVIAGLLSLLRKPKQVMHE